MRRTDYFDDDAAPPASGRAPGAVAAVFDAAGRMLVTRRTDNGMWVLPGGRLELGETITQTAVREVLEETGVEIAVTGVVGIHTDPGHVIAFEGGPVLQEFYVCLRARAVAGVARADGVETSEVRWVDAAGLGDLGLPPVMLARLAAAFDATAAPMIA